MELNDAQRARVEQSRAAALARKAALQEAIFYSGGRVPSPGVGREEGVDGGD